MKKFLTLLTLASLLLILLPAWKAPEEGMWLMTQIEKLPFSDMKKTGLELTAAQIYNPAATSLKDAIVLMGGGTASFVSPEGLLVTNHHVAFGAVQSVSSVKSDYLKDGMAAATHDQEIPIPNFTAQIVVKIKDVTAEVLSAVTETMSAEDRVKAIRAKSREIEKTERGQTEYECTVSETYNGVKYLLYVFETFRDIRLVYVPPSSVGNYGGEVDNWYWPRHTGDFSFMRAYVGPDGKHKTYAKENVPYKPAVYLPISTKGYADNSFAMVMGYPGRTYRYRTSTEIELARDETLPLTMDLFRKRMDLIEAGGANNRETQIKYASRWRGMANTYKNFQGTLEGMKRADIMKERKDVERQFQEFLASSPDASKKYGTVLSDIAAAYTQLRTFNRKQLVIGQLMSATDMLGLANRFKTFARSFAEDSTGHKAPPEASMNELKDAIPGAYKNLDLQVDQELLVAMILKAAELPREQQIEGIRKVVGDATGADREKRVRSFIHDLYEDSRLPNKDEALKFLTKSADDILDDPFVRFAVSLDKDNTDLQAQAAAFNAKIGVLRMHLIEAWMVWKGPDLYPDANRSLRLSYGVVKPYKPRDAVMYDYETTLTGVMEKETGEDPFIVPPKLRQIWEQKDFGRYADPRTRDIPVAFLASLDITGGNSGSPVINGKGELIGLAFDGNWESVVGDYLYQEPLNRSINVDARYILFFLDKYSNAQNLLNEMAIH